MCPVPMNKSNVGLEAQPGKHIQTPNAVHHLRSQRCKIYQLHAIYVSCPITVGFAQGLRQSFLGPHRPIDLWTLDTCGYVVVQSLHYVN